MPFDLSTIKQSIVNFFGKFSTSSASKVAIYSSIVLVVMMGLMIGAWPASPEDLALNATSTIITNSTFNAINEMNATHVVSLPFTNYQMYVGTETLLLFIMMISGAMGACIYTLWSIGNDEDCHFEEEYTKMKQWHYARPLAGAVIAFFFYLLIRGGLLTIGQTSIVLNLVVIAGLSGLVGMFSEQAILKLKELADALFTAKRKQNH